MQLPKFHIATPEETRQYYTWYISTMPARLVNFSALFRSMGGEGNLDFTPDSLLLLAEWLKRNVECRNYNESEIQVYSASAPAWLQHSLRQPILTDYWYNLCGDVGAYIGEVFRRNFPSLVWSLSSHQPPGANYGRPVLHIAPKLELSPITIAQTLMLSLPQQSDPGKRMMSIYSHWSAVLEKAIP